MRIRELPGKWRKRGEGGSQDGRTWGYNAACDELSTELEAALPKWTKITDDPTTWPQHDEVVMGVQKGWGGPLAVRYSNVEGMVLGKNETQTFITTGRVRTFSTLPDSEDQCSITHWRPLCDLDLPPEES